MNERFPLFGAVYLMPLKDNKILLLRRFNTGWSDGMYSLVSGHLDGNEDAYAAMIREAKEESGIDIKKEHLIPATVLHRKAPPREYSDFFFVCEKWDGEPMITEPDKCDDLSWFSLDSLPDNTLPYIFEAIDNYKNKKAFSVSGWE